LYFEMSDRRRADVLQGRTFTLVVVWIALVLSSCGASSDGTTDGSVFHPGEADAARSAQARDKVKACAEDRGWDLRNLELLVDDEGLLIRIAYRSSNIFPGTPEREVVDDCLVQADVTQPPPGL
jgi:hypothetical protein